MKSSPTRFIILAAARTGSNLLRDLVRSHPAVFAGSELFNPNLVTQGVIPWYELGSPSTRRQKSIPTRSSIGAPFIREIYR